MDGEDSSRVSEDTRHGHTGSGRSRIFQQREPSAKDRGTIGGRMWGRGYAPSPEKCLNFMPLSGIFWCILARYYKHRRPAIALTIMRRANDPLCPLCKEEEETSLHFLGKCCTTANTRRLHFGFPFLETGDLKQAHYRRSKHVLQTYITYKN